MTSLRPLAYDEAPERDGFGRSFQLPYLTITAADGRTFQRALDKDIITVGRSSKNDVNLSFDLSLSRFHAEIIRQGDRFLVRDVGSRNGTSVNGRQVEQPIELQIGDKITLGETTITFGDEKPPQVVLDDTPVSKETTTYAIPVEEIITKSQPGAAFVADGASIPRDAAMTLGAAPIADGRMMTIVNRATMELINHRPYEELLSVIMDLVFEAIPAERGFLMLLEGEEKRMVSKTVRDLTKSSGGAISLSRSIANMVIQNRQAVLTQDAQADERFRMRESVVLQGIRSAMCAPLYDNREVIGLIYVDTRNQGVSFRPQDLWLLTNLANIAALKIYNARLEEKSRLKELMDREIEQAAEIQNRLLPEAAPSIPGYEVTGHVTPARTVGGDYYDFVALGTGSTAIVIGDVSGKGMAAALLMASVQAVFRTLADTEAEPADLVTSLNKHLLRNTNPNKFVTFFYGDLERSSGTLRYVNAGHNPPYLVRASGEVEILPAGGCALGVFAEAKYEDGRIVMEPGDLLVLYTDGVTESQDKDEEMFGEERLMAVLVANRGASAKAIEQAVNGELAAFAAGADQYDDATLVILKRIG